MRINRIKNSIPGFLFIMPFMIFFFIFLLFPLFKAFHMSLFDLNYAKGPFVGLQNYFDIFKEYSFRKSILNTFLFVLGVVPTSVIFSIFVAVTVISKSEKIQSFIRGSFYLPVVTSGVVLSLIWLWILNPSFGLANYLLSLLHLQPITWLADKNTALPSLIFIVTTFTIGQPIVLFIAALGNIPKTYYEAADIDGANNIKKLIHITVPLLKPTTLYVIVINTIASFQIFQVVQLMTGGGPNYATSTIMYALYKEAFIFGKFGKACAMGVVLAAIIFVISIIQFKIFSSEVEY